MSLHEHHKLNQYLNCDLDTTEWEWRVCKWLVYFDSSSNVTWPRVTFMTDPAGACTLFLKDMTHGYKDLWSPRFHFNFTMIKSLPLLNYEQCPAKYWHININWTVAIPMANNSFYHKALLVPCGWAHNKCSNFNNMIMMNTNTFFSTTWLTKTLLSTAWRGS